MLEAASLSCKSKRTRHSLRYVAMAIALSVGACSDDSVEIPEFARANLAISNGVLTVKSRLELKEGEFVCLFHPYDEDIIPQNNAEEPFKSLLAEKYQTIFPVHDDEFVIALIGPTRSASN